MTSNIKLCLPVLGAVLLLLIQATAHATPIRASHEIAYVQTKHGVRTLLVQSVTNGSKKMLAKNVTGFAWSPDGKKISYFTGNNTCSTRLYVMDYASTHTRQISHGGCMVGSPVWAPNGKHIAFTRARGVDRTIVTMALAQGYERTVVPWTKNVVNQNPSWSPDGLRMVYERHDSARSTLQVVQLDNGAHRELTELSDYAIFSQPSWSPNGKKIVYQDSQNEAYTIWPDGSHRSVISDGDSYEASWSSGSRLAFMEDMSGVAFSVTAQDGAVEQHDLPDLGQTSAHKPRWSSDENNMLIIFGKGQETQLMRVDMQSTASTIVATQVVDAQWRP